MLKNAALIVKIGFDTAENEPQKKDVSWPEDRSHGHVAALGNKTDVP